MKNGDQVRADAGGLIFPCFEQGFALQEAQVFIFLLELHLKTMHCAFSPDPQPPHFPTFCSSHWLHCAPQRPCVIFSASVFPAASKVPSIAVHFKKPLRFMG